MIDIQVRARDLLANGLDKLPAPRRDLNARRRLHAIVRLTFARTFLDLIQALVNIFFRNFPQRHAGDTVETQLEPITPLGVHRFQIDVFFF